MDFYKMQQTESVCGGVQVRVRVPVFEAAGEARLFADRCGGHLRRLAEQFCHAICATHADNRGTPTGVDSAAMLVSVLYSSPAEVSFVADFARYHARRPTAFLRVGERWLLKTATLLPPPRTANADGWYRSFDGVYLYKNGFDSENPAHLRRPQSSVSVRVYAGIPRIRKAIEKD